MNENINLVEILRDCPKGLILYSSIHGPVEFLGVDYDNTRHINVKCLSNDSIYSYMKDGHYLSDFPNSEAVLFPNKKMRDWSKFFKRGDVLVSIGLNTFYAIFKEYTDEFYYFTAVFFAKEEGHTKRGARCLLTSEFSLATEAQKEFFISKIEKEFGGKLNLETLEIEKGHIFKPFDMVLVRDDDGDIWKCEFFSHYNVYSYGCINNFYKQCISYKGNEHLLGTKISPEHE